MTDDWCVILFVKHPAPGTVKTRLAPVLGNEAAARLSACMTLDVLTMLGTSGHPFRVFFSPADAGAAMRSWLGPDVLLAPQTGNDLGERMENALQVVFADGVERALIIGSDLPDLPAAVLDDAFHSLEGHDTVIGPAGDGGYYLIGCRRDSFRPVIFRGIAWSTPRVYQETAGIMERLSLKIHTLSTRDDIDTADDIRKFILRTLRSGDRPFETVQCLAEIGYGTGSMHKEDGWTGQRR